MGLNNFEAFLIDKGLTSKTISQHMMNVDFYINEFLCYYDVLLVTQGCHKISEFLGDWFIKK